MKPPVIIVGGTLNITLKRWLWQLSVIEYNHVSTRIEDISPDSIERDAEKLRDLLPANAVILSVGNLADKLLNKFFVMHGVLPPTSSKDKKHIETAIGQCRNYLTMRSYYDVQPQSPGPKIG